MIGLRNCGHLGRVGDWADLAAASGQVSLHFLNTSGAQRVAPYGGSDRRLSTNPITIGVPVAGGDPVVLDVTTSMVAEGKLMVALNKGERVPEGWIIDKNGAPTTSPKDFYDGGALLGAKILGNAIAVDIGVTEVVLGGRVVLLGRFAVPRHGLGVVLHDAPALVVGLTQIKLSAGIALVGSLFELVERGLVVTTIPGVESLLEVGLDAARQRSEKDERRKTSHCAPPKIVSCRLDGTHCGCSSRACFEHGRNSG
jgi:hypothetical protein